MKDEREELLTVARRHFCDTGIKDKTLEEIASEAGVDIGRAIEFFPDKIVLVFTVIQHELLATIDEAMKTLPESGVEVQFKHLLKKRFEFFANHRDSSKQVMREVFFSTDGWRETYDTMLWRFSVGAVALLQAAKRRQEIRQDANETLGARALISYYVTGMLMILRGEVADSKSACDFTFPLIDSLVDSLR